MRTPRSGAPDSCPYCPYFNGFHAACRHPLRQDVLQVLSDEATECPLYAGIRAEAMRELSGDFDRPSR